MATPWIKRIKDTGQLSVFNKATAWSDAAHAAITAFNQLSLGVKLVAAKDEKSANIVLVLASGHQQYTYGGDTTTTDSDFKPDRLHGETNVFEDDRLKAIFFAVIFLPGKVKGTKKQREVIVVHEFIHACGVEEHESVGIMFAQMKESDGGLIEYLPDAGAKAMPPIRVGPQTLCKVRMLWAGGGACKKN